MSIEGGRAVGKKQVDTVTAILEDEKFNSISDFPFHICEKNICIFSCAYMCIYARSPCDPAEK